MLTRVTLTGADDAVLPEELLALSADFPFVEWGILSSRKRAGTPRYPSVAWMRRLCLLAAGTQTQLALHLCGALSRDLMGGRCDIDQQFRRVQVNGWRSSARHTLAGVPRAFELVLQARSEESLQLVAFDAIGLGHASVLFDPSGGRGIEAFRWPMPPLGASVGYAGGIRPSNVVDVLCEIGPIDAPFWIDMESGVRSRDAFDIGLAREVLTLTTSHVFAERQGQRTTTRLGCEGT